jgi:acetylglutamate kinase
VHAGSEVQEDLASFASAALEISKTLTTLKGKIVVVKYGGNAMESKELSKLFCEDVATLQKLGVKVVVVHGGGPMINSLLKRLGIESTFAENGMRISTEEVVEGAALALCGEVNKNIANGICNAGGVAIGVSGRDARILECEKLVEDGVDIGNVGSVVRVNTKFLSTMLDNGITPVIAPIGCGMFENNEQEVVYNVNADVAAGRVAGELCAARALFLTNIPGVLDKEKNLLTQLNMDDISRLIKDETITGGMIPKVQFATSALSLGVEGAFITDGRVPHALLNEVLSNGGMGSGRGGTVITRK